MWKILITCSALPTLFAFQEISTMFSLCRCESLYTVSPNGDCPLELTHFLNKRPVLQAPTHTLVRLAELVLTLNIFSFNGNFYRQTGGVAMGSRLGPNYACLFMGHAWAYRGTNLRSVHWNKHIDDIAGATSGSREEIKDFATYVNGFHPSLNFTWVISDVQLPFLDLCLKLTSDRLLSHQYILQGNRHSFLPKLHVISPCPL